MLAIVGEAKAAAYEGKAMVSWNNAMTDVSAYLVEHGGPNWRETFVPMLEGVIGAQAENWGSVLGLEFDLRNLFSEGNSKQIDANEWFTSYQFKFAQPINETTLSGLSNMFAQAQAEGWSVPTMQKHIGSLFQQWAEGDLTSQDFDWYAERMPPHRTEAIARTETMRASNAGSHALFQDWGVQAKEWLTTHDARTRDSHLSAEAHYSEGGDPGPIPMSQPFVVNGYPMMYPGDAELGAPASEYIF